MKYFVFKRVGDVVLSCMGLMVLLPVLTLIAIAIKVESDGPVLFKQTRLGKCGRQFVIFKFRTMKRSAPSNVPTHLLNDAHAHITRVGQFLRRTSLDELPQILNILKGDMSIIGPRPALVNQHDLIVLRNKYDALCVYPGLSGLAQVKGRDALSIEQKAQLDGEYARNIGLKMDVYCFVKTVQKVIMREGIVEGKQ